MNNLVKTADGSLLDTAQRNGLTLVDVMMNARVMVLVDTSSSMKEDDAPGGKTRIDAAEEELRQIQRNYPGQVAVVSFSSRVEFCPGGVPTRQFDFTDVAAALEFALPADKAGVRVVLISDGQPDSETQAFGMAHRYKHSIDTVYCGGERDFGGREFLAELARRTGGVFGSGAAPGLLAAPVTLLLGGK